MITLDEGEHKKIAKVGRKRAVGETKTLTEAKLATFWKVLLQQKCSWVSKTFSWNSVNKVPSKKVGKGVT